jgi:molybdenum cofactor biosynthesis enzyme MoaA
MEQYVLHVTHQCNLRCKYCYETDRATTYTTDEILKTCDDILKSRELFSVEFIGGEPLLSFNHIKTAYEYIKSKTNLVSSFCISTNLTLLSDEIIEFLKKNEDVRVSVSVDGNKYMNQLRVTKDGLGTHDIVMENIRILLREIGDYRTAVHMVSHPYNVGYICDGIKYLYDNGVRRIAVGIIESTVEIGEEFATRYISEMNKLSKEILINDTLTGLSISELEGLKPESDVRTYVYDDDGKIVFETYGRSKDDAVTRGEVNAVPVSGDSTELIKWIRRKVFEIHQLRKMRTSYNSIKIESLQLRSCPRKEMDKMFTAQETLDKLNDILPFECDLYTTTYCDDIHTSVIVARDNKDIRFNGKGITPEYSEVSAIAELIERISSFQLPIPMYPFTKDVDKLLYYSRFENIERYDNDVVELPHLKQASELIDYIPRMAYSLLQFKPVGIDTRLISLDQGSNGLAAGNSYEEAIVQAACEVFERFCLNYSAAEQLKLFPTIDTSTIKNDIIQRQLDFYKNRNYDVWIKYIGYDLFPVWGVLFENKNKSDTDPSRYTYVCAGSFNSDIAIIRCLTEKAQIGLDSEGVSFTEGEPLKDLVDGGRTTLDLNNLKKGKVISYRRWVSDNFLNDIYEIIIICKELNTDFIVIDHTRYDFPVVCVVIPDVSSTGMFYSYDRVVETIKNSSMYNMLL